MNRKEVINYLIFGVLTTVVNIVVYWLLNTCLNVNYLVSNAIAWIISVLFAYITNRKYVFESKNSSMVNELVKFVSARLSTGIMDMIMMWLLVDVLFLNTMVSKVLVNVLVIVLNYVFSKVFVFREKE